MWIKGGCEIQILVQSEEVEKSNETESSQVLSSADLQWNSGGLCFWEGDWGHQAPRIRSDRSQDCHLTTQTLVLSLHIPHFSFLLFKVYLFMYFFCILHFDIILPLFSHLICRVKCDLDIYHHCFISKKLAWVHILFN